MQQLFDQLGIDWHLLLSQAVNFFILLVVLRVFIYKPLLKLLHDRRARIEEGLMKADEADKRLAEVDIIGKGKIKDAESQALNILKKTEVDARKLEAEMFAEAKRKGAEEFKNLEAILHAREQAAHLAIEKEAALLIKRAIVRTVELSPEKIDDALIEKSVKEMKHIV
ncbi:MAG: hypothetical protein KGJ89_02610 [Patescibacteria group bacterium]|nr:hypothetical protein [Patescibacteria group bacterium]MDE2015770.1 hypothetical protein [Patescibacteria group bacterium]MDE2226827.1 hypothetical protein [Patescibacteria group bacterium]